MKDTDITYPKLWHRLLGLYDQREATAIVRTLLSELFDMTLTDIVGGGVEDLSDADKMKVESSIERLEKGEPLQYVLGYAWFAGRKFNVDENVLIPRPETEELCRIIADDCTNDDSSDESKDIRNGNGISILDIGTGSGCIAVTLDLDIQGSDVSAWDISPDALAIARTNAAQNSANVDFAIYDALDINALPKYSHYDIIVSNPPYICDNERSDMRTNVLDHEPSLALFVPDDDPLRFYRAIATYAVNALNPGGRLYFEINPLYADDMQIMFSQLGYHDIIIGEDQFGKRRFAIGQR